jgi:hypothetical protein
MEDSLNISPTIFDLCVLLITVFYVAHLVACLWWGLSSVMSSKSWFNDPGQVWVSNLAEAPLAHKYIVSLYWTFTTFTTVRLVFSIAVIVHGFFHLKCRKCSERVETMTHRIAVSYTLPLHHNHTPITLHHTTRNTNGKTHDNVITPPHNLLYHRCSMMKV